MNAGSRHQYRGSLAERTLPEVLRTIDYYRVPGVVEATRHGERKRLYVKDRNIVSTSSTDIQDSLGCYMLNTGMIDVDTFRATMRERRASDRRYGVLLLDQGHVAPADLYRAIRLQMAEILWSLFTWTEGEITFTVGDFAEPTGMSIQIPLRLAIKEGARRCAQIETLAAFVGGETAVLHPNFDQEQLIEVSVTSEEQEILELIDGERSVGEVIAAASVPRDLTIQLIYGFFVLKFIRRPGSDDSSGVIRLRLDLDEES